MREFPGFWGIAGTCAGFFSGAEKSRKSRLPIGATWAGWFFVHMAQWSFRFSFSIGLCAMGRSGVHRLRPLTTFSGGEKSWANRPKSFHARWRKEQRHQSENGSKKQGGFSALVRLVNFGCVALLWVRRCKRRSVTNLKRREGKRRVTWHEWRGDVRRFDVRRLRGRACRRAPRPGTLQRTEQSQNVSQSMP